MNEFARQRENLMTLFAGRLKERRLAERLTQRELANAINTTDETISRYERGLIMPSYVHLRRLVIRLSANAAYFLCTDAERKEIG